MNVDILHFINCLLSNYDNYIKSERYNFHRTPLAPGGNNVNLFIQLTSVDIQA